MHRRIACIVLTLLGGCTSMAPVRSPFLPEEDMRFLEELAAAVMEASRVPEGGCVGSIGPNVTGGPLIRPGGRDCYPAFWIRDYAMSLESGLVKQEEQRHMLLLTASNQQDEEWKLESGSRVPPGSIPDHITFGGKPIFFPGTLEDFEGQGGERWGILPCLDDSFFFIHMAARYIEDTGDEALLNRDIRGKTLLQRLEDAYRMPPSREDSGLVRVEAANRGITFGFMDTVTHTGDLLFASVLKYRAALELSPLMASAGRKTRGLEYLQAAKRLKEAIGDTFAAEKGLLRASTETSAQPDAWGTAFAVYAGALKPEIEEAACEGLARACREGALAWRGNIRHVPATDDFSETTAWEKALAPLNRYQNGAYWGTPLGWVCHAIAKVDRGLAVRLTSDYVKELREGDFRKGPDFHSPWECMHPDGDHRQNAVYLTSVTCPLAAFKRL